ncbi:transcriptional repressor [Tepidibacillus marianensis]|uniref:transcriptional repressor n=1 Tax=Tepidibacillus marianensis TaxID=3131995 RepID=UPI0030D2A60A
MNTIKKALEERNIGEFRITPQLKALKKKFSSISMATIYNNLRAFKNAGLVQEFVKNIQDFKSAHIR